MLTRVNSLAGSASTSSQAGSIMMHHSRDTAHKQWAETQVLILTGVARYVCVYLCTYMYMSMYVCVCMHLCVVCMYVYVYLVYVLCVHLFIYACV